MLLDTDEPSVYERAHLQATVLGMQRTEQGKVPVREALAAVGYRLDRQDTSSVLVAVPDAEQTNAIVILNEMNWSSMKNRKKSLKTMNRIAFSFFLIFPMVYESLACLYCSHDDLAFFGETSVFDFCGPMS